MFSTYFELGFDHILDIKAYDHILFIVALCAIYTISQWRDILILVTAFTIGHCMTLVLSGLKLVNVNADLVEFLIPLTILMTAIINILQKQPTPSDIEKSNRKLKWNYVMALLFGLIHGLGFSNYFKALIGQEENIVSVLLPFNLGVEAGQIIIVAIIMLIAWVVLDIFKAKQREWTLFISGAAAGIAVTLMIG